MKDRLSRQEGKHRHVSANTATECRVRPDLRPQLKQQTRPVPVKAKSGFFYGLWLRLLFKLKRRKIFIAGLSKTRHFTLTGRFSSAGGLFVSSPEKVLYVPHHVYGVEGIVTSVRLGTLVTETFKNARGQEETVIWKIIEIQEPNRLLARRVAREVK